MVERARFRNFVCDSARWDGLRFRDDDIVISTPPKCGTTWMQMLCALLIFRTPDLPRPLAELSPWIDMNTRPLDDVLRALDQQTHRRFIKTHTPLDCLPFDDRVTYLHVARDPRDAALSWDAHLANMDMGKFMAIRVEAVGVDDLEEIGLTEPPSPPPDDPVERYWLWMEGAPGAAGLTGLEELVRHVQSFWSHRDAPNVHLFHYGDLRADLAGQMTRLAGILGLEPPTDDLVESARFESMKARAESLVPNSDTSFWHDTSTFFNRARSGGWREVVGDDDTRYRQALKALGDLPDDLVRWLHEGWLGEGAPTRRVSS